MSEIKVNLPTRSKNKALEPGKFYLLKDNLVFVSSKEGSELRAKTRSDVTGGLVTVASISGDFQGYSLVGLLGEIQDYEEVDVEITVKRK